MFWHVHILIANQADHISFFFSLLKHHPFLSTSFACIAMCQVCCCHGGVDRRGLVLTQNKAKLIWIIYEYMSNVQRVQSCFQLYILLGYLNPETTTRHGRQVPFQARQNGVHNLGQTLFPRTRQLYKSFPQVPDPNNRRPQRREEFQSHTRAHTNSYS